MDDIQVFVGTSVKLTKKETVYHVEKKNNNCSMVYYYDNPDDIKSVEEGGLNLVADRPWPTFIKTYKLDGKTVHEKKSGRNAFNDITIYKPIQMKNYIDKYFIDPFKKSGRKNPFMFYENDVKDTTKFDLNPQQKFCGQFMSYNTDFAGLLDYKGIGSGKTNDAMAAAMAFVSKYKVGQTIKEINERKVCVKNNNYVNCTVTFVVPKNLINDYVEALLGKIEDGKIKSATGMCLVYCQEDDFSENNAESYRQFYQGTSVNGQYENLNLQQIKNYEQIYEANESEIQRLSTNLEKNEYSDKQKNEMIIKINKLKEEQEKLTSYIKVFHNNLNKDINDIFFIVTHETFVSRLQQKIKKNDKTEYTASDFVLGSSVKFVPNSKINSSYRGTPIHPDCLHSNKTLFIIDEIQKSTSEEEKGKAIRYLSLYNTLFIYARSFIDASFTARILLLTATPVYNNPFQMCAMINLLRPRLMFPRKTKKYYELFVNKQSKSIKNRLLHSYMLSGYVSYLRGGNPEGYPYRKNIIVLHKMGDIQYHQYKDNLKKDIDIMKKEKINLQDNVYGDEYENKNKNMYRHSSNICMCAFPENQKEVSKRDDIAELKVIIKTGKFEQFSCKLKDVGDHLKNAKGKIFVYSGNIERGLYPLACYMEYIGFEFIGLRSNYKKQASALQSDTKMRYGIWSDTLYKEYLNRNLINENQYIFREKIKNLFNDPLNKDGSVCKVMLGNIIEGVSFIGVTEIHILEPWWNEAKQEQTVGRGIRYLSHADLPANKQHIDIYYHCSVLPTYPEKDESLESILGKKNKKCAYCKTKADKKNNKKVEGPKIAKKPAGYNYYISDILVDEDEQLEIEETIEEPSKKNKNKKEEGCTCDLLNTENNKSPNEYLNKISIEQKIYIISREKNKINKEFEQNLKETAVDYDLNKYGNIVRLEEFVYEGIKEKLMYNRATNQFFVYKNNALYNATIDMSENEWPPTKVFIEDLAEETKTIKKTIKDHKGSLMVIADVIEKINSFNGNPEYNNKNFYELKEYAISKGEEKEAWDYIEKYNKVNDLITILIKHNRNIKPDDILKNYNKFIDQMPI
jgi:hypothetical protein